MQSITLHEDDGLRTYLLVMESGDEAVAEILAFAREAGVNAASLTAIGGARGATLGYFDPDVNEYRWTSFDEQLELASWIGDIADNDGALALHAHVVLGRRDSSALAGHIRELHVHPTMEVVLTESPAHLRKKVDPATGLALISARDSTGA
jgi:predicted DNA-binding protein with PD1-like motif